MLASVRLSLPLMGPFARQLGHPSGPLGRLITNGLNVFNKAVMAGSIAALQAQPGDQVADIGFGGGYGLQALLGQVGPHGHVYGIDVSTTMITKAHKRFEEYLANDRLRLIEASMRDLPIEAATFDGVVTVNTIYYIEDQELTESFAEVARVLRPGGKFVVGAADSSYIESTPWRDGLIKRSRAEVEAIIEQAGFTTSDHRRVGESDRAFHVYVAERPSP